MKKRKTITIKLAIPKAMQNVLEKRAAKEGKDVPGFLKETLLQLLLDTVVQEYETWRNSFRKHTRRRKNEQTL